MKALTGGLIVSVAIVGSAWAQGPPGAEARLKEGNITLPSPATPVANYVPAVRVGILLFVSGHGPGQVFQRFLLSAIGALIHN